MEKELSYCKADIRASHHAVKEGDSRRLLQSMKIALLFLHTYGRVKYAYAVLLFLAKFHAILPSGMAFELIHNRFCNVSGKAGGNIPLDLRMEHLNKLLKTALKQLGSNISEDAAQRIAKALPGLERLISNVDSDCNVTGKRGYHNAKHLKETVLQITQDLLSEEAVSLAGNTSALRSLNLTCFISLITVNFFPGAGAYLKFGRLCITNRSLN